jgi:hypothetical protein
VEYSPRYVALSAQISALRRHLLPKKLSPTGNYVRPDRVSVHSLSFRILCVAEIENYLEDRCAEIAKTALNSWRTNRHFSPPLQSLTVFTDVKYDALPDYMIPKPKDQKDWDNLVSPAKRIEKAVSEYLTFVQSGNNGIREKNLIGLLIPVGLDLRAVDRTLLDRMDALGSRRGDAAHTSCAKALKIGVDPAAEKTDIETVLEGLADVDARLDGLLAAST